MMNDGEIAPQSRKPGKSWQAGPAGKSGKLASPASQQAWASPVCALITSINLALHSTKNKISGENIYRKFQTDNYCI